MQKRITVNLTNELAEQLRALAYARKSSLADAIRHCVTHYNNCNQDTQTTSDDKEE
jgi:hypothetical protein